MTELTEPEDEYPEVPTVRQNPKYLQYERVKTLPVKICATSSGILKLRRGLRFCSENS